VVDGEHRIGDTSEPGRRTARSTILREAAWIGGAAVLALVFVYLLLALVFGGWGDKGRTNGIYAQNRTDGDLTFRVLVDTGWFNVSEVAEPYLRSHSNVLVAGPSLLDRNGCTTGPMVALAKDGREIARREAPVCLGDDGQELWVIGSTGASPSD
jgi:hypothetical protein